MQPVAFSGMGEPCTPSHIGLCLDSKVLRWKEGQGGALRSTGDELRPLTESPSHRHPLHSGGYTCWLAGQVTVRPA